MKRGDRDDDVERGGLEVVAEEITVDVLDAGSRILVPSHVNAQLIEIDSHDMLNDPS